MCRHKSLWLIVLFTLLAGCRQEQVSIGNTAPPLAAFDLQGQQVNLDRWQGKAIYLTFWSASCGGCIAEMATLEKLRQQGTGNLVIVAINTDSDNTDIQSILARHPVSFPVLRDQLGITQERYLVTGTPTAFLINASGDVIDQYQGMRDAQTLSTLLRKQTTENP